MADWDLTPGEHLTRTDRMIKYGGARFGGIEPSTLSPNVFIYSDPTAGSRFGYDYDGWTEDKAIFLYTGEGRVGDQRLVEGNAAITNHVDAGRALRVFVADGYVEKTKTRQQLYLGEFAIDDVEPFHSAQAPDVNGDDRTVLVFHLRPRGEVIRRDDEVSPTGIPPSSTTVLVESDSAAVVAASEVEGHHTPTFEQQPPTEPVTAIRREADLVRRYRRCLETQGLVVRSRLIRPPGEARSLRTDLYIETTDELCEAKGVTTRDSVRNVVGQILDYRRHLDAKVLSVLLPTRPSDDLIAFIHSLGIACVYEEAAGTFVRLDPL